jgi:hypothetical protein
LTAHQILWLLDNVEIIFTAKFSDRFESIRLHRNRRGNQNMNTKKNYIPKRQCFSQSFFWNHHLHCFTQLDASNTLSIYWLPVARVTGNIRKAFTECGVDCSRSTTRNEGGAVYVICFSVFVLNDYRLAKREGNAQVVLRCPRSNHLRVGTGTKVRSRIRLIKVY